MRASGQVRWGIVGTANIARAQFLPALRQAGGIAAAVASRDAERAAQFASDNGIGRSIAGYENLVTDPGLDALYIPLPNSLHAEWTIRALEAGRPVLCEKPLCGTLPDTERVLEVAGRTGAWLWEAFAFPFHLQLHEIKKLLQDGVIGELMEIKSNFHFSLRNPANIRLSRQLQGGALLDLGCYPVRLAQELFGPTYDAAWASAVMGGDGVDVDTWGVLNYRAGGGLCCLAACAEVMTPSRRWKGRTGRSAPPTRSTPGRLTPTSWSLGPRTGPSAPGRTSPRLPRLSATSTPCSAGASRPGSWRSRRRCRRLGRWPT